MKKHCCLLFLLFFVLDVCAQNHYWSQQYGAENTMLGGAVVAGVEDNSAMFYNPGRLGFIEAPKFSVSANAYGIDLVNLKNAAGTKLDLRSAKLMLYPQIASGSINIRRNPKFKMVYGSLVRYRTALHYEQSAAFNYDVYPNLPGDEFYNASVEYDYNGITNWFGAAFGYKINDHWAVGYSQFFSYSNLQYHQNYNITSDNKIGSTYFVSSNHNNINFTINNVNAIEKLGIAYETKSSKKQDLIFRLGLTGTMPSLRIFNLSKVSQSLELNNIVDQNISVTDSFTPAAYVLYNSNKRIKSNFKEAGSIALGFEVENKHIRFCASVEYFVGVKDYNMIKDNSLTEERPVQNNKPTYISDFMTIKQSNQPIVNGAIGFEYKFKTKVKAVDKERTWSLLLGIRTDFNNHDQVYRLQKLQPGKEAAFNPDNWKYIHYSLGVSVDRKTDKFSFGIDYGKGLTRKTQQAINITEPSAANYLLGEKQNSVVPQINSINFVMGYNYHFNKTSRLINMKPL